MHIVTRPRSEVLTVKFKDKTYQVSMGGDGAFVPEDLGQYMVARGLVGKGPNPDPKQQWEKIGSGWGDAIDKFAPYVREVPPSDVDEDATPEIIAMILGKGKPA